MKTKKELKEYQKEKYQEDKEKIKAKRDTPEYKARANLYYQNHKEESKAKRDTPEYKEKMKEYMKNYNQLPEVILKKKEKDTPEYKEKMNKQIRNSYLKKTYNLSLENYNKLVEQQNNECAICGNNETVKQNGKITRLAVDHDWETGKVRGLLCKNCNTTLGNLNEDISLFEKCIKYLEKHSG